MLYLFFFFFGSLLGFFDLFYLFVFIIFLLLFFPIFICFEGFYGFFFCDGLTGFLIYLRVLLFLYCLISRLFVKWGGAGYFRYLFFVRIIFFFVYLSFFCLNVLVFYLCFEFIFFLMFVFLLSWGYRYERLQASFYMVFYTLVVSFPFLVFFVFVLGFSVTNIFFIENENFFWVLFVLVVFLVKLPVYGVHL